MGTRARILNLQTRNRKTDRTIRSGTAFLALSLVISTAGRIQASEVPDNSAELEAVLQESKNHIAEGHFPEAIASLNRLKQATPLDPRAYFFSGIALAESGHLSAAAAELNEAVRLGPGQPQFVVSLANVLTRLGQKKQALKALEFFGQADRLKLLTPAALEQLIDIYLNLGNTDATLKAVEVLAQIQPGGPGHDFYRGKAYQLIGNLDLAQMAMERCISKAPEFAAAHLELGRIFEQRGSLDAARQQYLAAVQYADKNPECLYALGSLLLLLGDVDEAIHQLERALPVASQFPRIYYALGQAFQRKGNLKEGARYFNLQKAQEANAADRKKEMREHELLTLVTLGEEKLRQGSESEARALFEQALQLDPNNWQANEYLAQMYLSRQDWPRALQQINRLVEVDPLAFEGNYLLADYWYLRRDFARARAFAEKAKAAQPGDAALHNLLGNIFLGLGSTQQAVEEYKLAVQYAPDRTDFKANLDAAHTLGR